MFVKTPHEASLKRDGTFMHSKHWISTLALTAGLVMGGFVASGSAQAQTTIRIAWYSDGNEGEVLTDLLKRFEAQNKDIKVVLDQVPYKAITENLPVQLASGQGSKSSPSPRQKCPRPTCPTCAPSRARRTVKMP